MVVCTICGGKEVQVLAWVDANTNVYESGGVPGVENTWCIDCQVHTDLVTEEEYKKKTNINLKKQ